MDQRQTGPPHRHYTASEIAAANDTDLPDLLASLGYQVRRAGRYYTTKEMDSLRIWNRRTWYRFSEAVGGNAIDFLCHFHGLTFPETVGFLLAFNGYPVDVPGPLPARKTRPPPQRERPAFVLPPPNGDNELVRAYLLGRGISTSVIDGFIEAGLLYEDERHNCVFVGRDGAGKAVFAARRSTQDYAPFKGDVAGSDKRVAFRLPCGPLLDWVAAFEAPIDLMSWFTLYGKTNAVALCGLYDGPLGTYLADYPHVRRVVLCLDADGPGREAAGRLGEKYRGLGYITEERLPPSGKDWNECLQIKRDNAHSHENSTPKRKERPP